MELNSCLEKLTLIPSCNKLMVFLSLRQEIKITMEEQILVLCSALKWRVAIVAKQRAPMVKPAKV